MIERNCEQARYLAARVAAEPRLELMAPVALNIVCFRVHAARPEEGAWDLLNADLVADLQESGIAAPSTTTLGGRTAIRVCLTNHRTRQSDLDALIEAVLGFGERRRSGAATQWPVPQRRGWRPSGAARSLSAAGRGSARRSSSS